MQNKRKSIIISTSILLLFLLSLVSLLSLKYFPYTCFENQIVKKFHDNPTAYPETYDSLCKIEYDKKIFFPKTKAEYAILHFDKFLKRNIQLTNKQLEELLVFLNDSSNYCWGELGTPYFDRFITFHNKIGECVGLTKIDFWGQTYSTPHLSLMKWGLVNPKNHKLIKLIKEIEAK